MNYINLPKDIKKMIINKLLLCVIKFLIFETIFVVISIYLLSWEFFLLKTTVVFRWFFVSVLFLAPFYLSKFPFKLIDKSWRGVVTCVDIKEKTGSYVTGGQKIWPYATHTIFLTVKKDDGKSVEIAVREFGKRHHKGFEVPNEADICNFIDEYSVGDVVYHFYLLDHYFVSKQKCEKMDCVVCGTENHKNTTSCINCGHTLIYLDQIEH